MTNRPAAYDSGVVNEGHKSTFDEVTIYGFFEKQGFIHYSRITNTDPDYNQLTDCVISCGTAVISPEPEGDDLSGNTGIAFINCSLYGGDHSKRADSNPDIPCLYIDGPAGSSTGATRGHTFIGCNFRTYVDRAVYLNRCKHVMFSAITEEFPALSDGGAGLDQPGQIVTTANTKY